MTGTFIDPRDRPSPDTPRPPPRTTNDPNELAALHLLCHGGELYEIEQWIREDRPLQTSQTGRTSRRSPSALEIALAAGNQSLVYLLLCNGYDPNLERECVLTATIRARQWTFVDLLLAWDADPLRVDPGVVCESYNTAVIERFHALGLDLTADHALGGVLAEHAGNKPLFGFAKRHREENRRIQVELDLALAHHAREGNAKGVQLSLWAGADPHAPAPDLRWGLPQDEDPDDWSTAVYGACSAGHAAILDRLHPDPSRDDFEELFRAAANADVIERLARHGLPTNVGMVLRSQLHWLDDRGFGLRRSTDGIQRLFSAGVRWTEATPEDITEVRRSLLRMNQWTFVEVMKILATADHCAPAILAAIARTSALRARMKAVGFLPSKPGEPWRDDRLRPTRAREVIAKFGVPVPKPPRNLPRIVSVGSRYGADAIVRLDRQTLFDHVWTAPVEQLAATWGLSGRGLAKVCARARIPVPPRGYWAKQQHGKPTRRPALPTLRPGEITEIEIYVRSRSKQKASADPEPRATAGSTSTEE